MEKAAGMPVSMYCDRDSANVPKNQVGFLANVIAPLFETWCQFLDSDEIFKHGYAQVRKNIRYWKDRAKAKRRSNLQSIIAAQPNFLSQDSTYIDPISTMRSDPRSEKVYGEKSYRQKR